MRYLPSGVVGASFVLLVATVCWAEGTAQLGANQDLVEDTEIKVDVVTAGEVINISAGNDSSSDPSPVAVTVLDPDGYPVAGSPFTIAPGGDGFLNTPNKVPGAIAKPLRITTLKKGTYTVQFDNTRTDMGQSSWANVVDPFDITVTPDTTTPVDPANPPGDYGRIHSTRWQINAHAFTKDAASNASFYVLTPTTPGADHTWLLQFNGLAGYQFDVRGNDLGLPAPNASRSIDEYVDATPCPAGYRLEEDRCRAIPPDPQFEVYLKVPQAGQGGSQAPTIEEFKFTGVAPFYDCAVPDLESTFSFSSDSPGTYQLIIDLNGDGRFEPQTGDLLLSGKAQKGGNTLKWDGRLPDGSAAPKGDLTASLSVRVGEFHFVGQDIETANPGLRVFSVDPPKPATVPQPTLMFWDDSQINDRQLAIAPDSTLPDGLSSGAFAAPAVCSAPGASGPNAHCWGSFTADPTLSPGDERYVDTWVFAQETVAQTKVCVGDANDLLGVAGGGGCQLGGRGATVGLLLPLLLLGLALARRRG